MTDNTENPMSASKIKPYPDGGEYVDFDGEMDSEVERWLGGNFESWLPSTSQLVVRFDNGIEAVVSEGDYLVRLDDGVLRVYFAGVKA